MAGIFNDGASITINREKYIYHANTGKFHKAAPDLNIATPEIKTGDILELENERVLVLGDQLLSISPEQLEICRLCDMVVALDLKLEAAEKVFQFMLDTLKTDWEFIHRNVSSNSSGRNAYLVGLRKIILDCEAAKNASR